jgi:glycosyltransferase involved in cell wall biosynthesis
LATPSPRPDTLLLCPELFAAEGGISRVSRLYLETLAAEVPGALHLVVLNDAAFDPAQMRRHAKPPPATAIACARSKVRFLRATLAATANCPRALATQMRILPVLALARLLRPRLAYDVVLHGIEAWQPVDPFIAHGLRRARRVYCVSQYTADRVAELHPTVAPRLRVLPNAIDPELAASLRKIAPADAEPGRILAVSRLAPHDHTKGIDHLIAALPAIRERAPAATLHIVGDGADRARLAALAAASPARDAITFHGILDETALREQSARCQLFALPSDKEGFGLVYAEAMNAGRPSIAARSGGAPEVVGLAGEGGLLVPYADVPALAAACVAALARDWDAAALRERAELFNLATFHRNFVNLWNQA